MLYLTMRPTGHMVNDHSDIERGNPLPPLHRLLFSSGKGSFMCTITQTGFHIPQPLIYHSWNWPERKITLYYVLSCLWGGAYKRTLAANRKE